MSKVAIIEFLTTYRYLLSVVASAIIGVFLEKQKLISAKRKPCRRGKWRYLIYGRGYQWSSVAFLICSSGALVLTFVSPVRMSTNSEVVLVKLFFLLFSSFSALLFYEFCVRQVRYNEFNLESVHPFRTRSTPISEIRNLTYYEPLGLVKVVLKGGGRLWLPFTSGTIQFARLWRLRSRQQIRNKISIEKMSQRPHNSKWDSMKEVSDRLESEGMTDAQLARFKAVIISLPATAVVAWIENEHCIDQVLVLSGQAALLANGHEFSLHEGDTASQKDEPYLIEGIANSSNSELRLLIFTKSPK